MFVVKISSKHFIKTFTTFEDARNFCVDMAAEMRWKNISGTANDECAMYLMHDNSGYFYIRINKIS